MRNDFETNFLMHHGILGMKWGVQNGPPYPLNANRHSASEKKAGYQKSIKGSGGSYSGIFKKKKKAANNVETRKNSYTPEEQKAKLDKEWNEDNLNFFCELIS